MAYIACGRATRCVFAWLKSKSASASRSMSRLRLIACLMFLILTGSVSLTTGHPTFRENDWPQRRGPDFNGMARRDAPTQWSTTKNVKWKMEIPGKGNSTPIIWGDRIFLTTAIPTGAPPQPVAAEPQPQGGRG